MTADGVDHRFESIEDILTGFATLEEDLYRRKDRRAVFVSAYLTMTREIDSRVESGHFNDPAWVTAYTLAFANLYRSALVAFEAGAPADVPRPWRTSFEVAVDAKGLIIQDLLLGMNAHINHDLALALVEASIDANRDARREDHFAVNEAIRHAVDAVQQRIAGRYGRVFAILDHLLGRFDEHTSVFSIEKARLNAWSSAIALADARGDIERQAVLESIIDHSNVIARLILLPTRGRLVLTLRRVMERLGGRWRLITPGF